jgi:hypothetical protein
MNCNKCGLPIIHGAGNLLDEAIRKTKPSNAELRPLDAALCGKPRLE